MLVPSPLLACSPSCLQNCSYLLKKDPIDPQKAFEFHFNSFPDFFFFWKVWSFYLVQLCRDYSPTFPTSFFLLGGATELQAESQAWTLPLHSLNIMEAWSQAPLVSCRWSRHSCSGSYLWSCLWRKVYWGWHDTIGLCTYFFVKNKLSKSYLEKLTMHTRAKVIFSHLS